MHKICFYGIRISLYQDKLTFFMFQNPFSTTVIIF
jgi:hypothetical protein